MKSIYEAVWDESYGVADSKTVSHSYFHSANGYDEDEIQSVLTLAVGELVKLDDGHHTVKHLA
jgi:hypothetical protein